jgi:phosphoribosylanthranilate isomerase
MLVQIYEIQTPQEAEKCISLGVNRIGSVLLSLEAWRQPSIREVIRLSGCTGTRNSLIPLFQDMDTLCRALDYYNPHYLHFCETLTDPLGRETDLEGLIRLQADLKEKYPDLGIVRSIPVPADGYAGAFPTLRMARSLEPVSDCFLIDTWLGQEPVEGFVGITGRTCDWNRAGELIAESDIPVILAGGLAPENVYDAVFAVMPAGVDSCTQTNGVDGAGRPQRFKKDFHKVAKFVKEARRAEEDIRRHMEGLGTKVETLKEELREREAALPPHSVRPHQIMAIEALEEEIALLEKEIKNFQKTLVFDGDNTGPERPRPGEGE